MREICVMCYEYVSQMDAAAELGRNAVRKHQIQPEYRDEEAGAGQDCRTRLARLNSQARTRTGKIYLPCLADHEQDWQPYPADPYSHYMCDHTYIHTYILISALITSRVM